MNINLKLFMIWECYGGLEICLDHIINNSDTERPFRLWGLFQY